MMSEEPTNVYKDGHHLYEGTVSEFSDGDFKHAKLYNYVIERVEDGNVVDVIALADVSIC